MAGNKKKSKSKAKASSAAPKESGWESIARQHNMGPIDHAMEWSVIVDVLCKHFDLPDLQTRRGLKKAYLDFDNIRRRLDKTYDTASTDWRLAGGIIAIYSKMCMDAMLRNKIFGPSYLSKLMSLAEIEPCRHLVARALSVLTHHGGYEVRAEIARVATIKLLDLVAASPEDGVLAELSVSVLGHSVTAIVGDHKHTPSSTTMKVLDYTRVLKQTVTTLYKFPTSIVVGHAMQMFASGTLNAPEAYTSVPSALEFLVAGLNSSDHILRTNCLNGIVQRFERNAQDDEHHMDPAKIVYVQRFGYPSHLQDIIVKYGYERSELRLNTQSQSIFVDAIYKAAADHDILALGRTIAGLIPLAEFPILHGSFQSTNPRTGREEADGLGLPFVMWGDSLTHCAKALRAAGELDSADMLDIKYAVTLGRQLPVAEAIAQRGLVRNPQCAYFYYTVSLAAARPEALRACKKGLKCKQTTPFIRRQLLQHAVEHAFAVGLQDLLDEMSAGGMNRYAKGFAFLISAAEDAKTFVEEAPPDNYHHMNVLYLLILLTFVTQEMPVGKDLSEVQPLIRKLKIAEEFARAMGMPPRETTFRLAQQLVLRTYRSAVEDWASVITRAESMRSTACQCGQGPEESMDGLAEWLDGVHIESREGEARTAHGPAGHACGMPGHERPKMQMGDFELYRCSYCRNPSAVLRKCTGCATARYCDAQCQKAGWSTHKKLCGRTAT